MPEPRTPSPHDGLDLGPFAETAARFWGHHAVRDPRRVILVEAMSQDLRVTLRTLAVANALTRVEPADVVVLSGTDEDWDAVVWSYFDLDLVTGCATPTASGRSSTCTASWTVGSRGAVPRARDDATRVARPRRPAARLGHPPRAPRRRRRRHHLPDGPGRAGRRLARVQEKRARVSARAEQFSRVYDALLADLDVVAVVSSHVDYDNFGLLVEAGLRHGVPVLSRSPPAA